MSTSPEEVDKAQAFINRDPAGAAWQLADTLRRYHELQRDMEAIRFFSQNQGASLHAPLRHIENVLGRKLTTSAPLRPC